MTSRYSSFMKLAYLLAFSIIVSGCSSSIHEDFVKNLTNDSRTHDRSIQNLIVSLTFDDKTKYLAVARESGAIEIWNARKPQAKRLIKAHDHQVNWMAFTEDGNSFFSNSHVEQTTKLWNAKTGELLHTISVPDMRGPVCRTSDENIYLVSQTSQIRIFDIERKLLLDEVYESSGVITAMAVDVASGQIAVGTASGSMEIWKFTKIDGKPSLQKRLSAEPYSPKNWIVGLQFSPDGTSLYSVARFGSIDQWTTHSLERNRAIPTSLKHISSVAFIRNKELLAVGGTQNESGTGRGFIELIALKPGTSTIRGANTNRPTVEFLPSLDTLIAAQIWPIEAYTFTDK